MPQPSAQGLQGWGREGGCWASWRHGPPPASTADRLIPRQAHSPGTILESSLLDQALGVWLAAQSGLGVVSGRGSLRADGPLCSPCRNPGSPCPSPQPPRGAGPGSLCPGPLGCPSYRSPAPPPSCPQPPTLCSRSGPPPPLRVSPPMGRPHPCVQPLAARGPSHVPPPHFPPHPPTPVHLKCKSPETNSCN